MIYLIPIICGIAVIIQPMLNRALSAHYGIFGAILINSFVLSTGSALLYFVTRTKLLSFGALFDGQPFNLGNQNQLHWWYVIPGLCGLTIICLVPYAFSRLSASTTFVLLVASQLTCAALVDRFYLHQPITLIRSIGILLTLFGAFLTQRA